MKVNEILHDTRAKRQTFENNALTRTVILKYTIKKLQNHSLCKKKKLKEKPKKTQKTTTTNKHSDTSDWLILFPGMFKKIPWLIKYPVSNTIRVYSSL